VRDVGGLVRREIIAMNRFERSFARQAARELFARALTTQRQDRPEVTLQ
jgi:hypothetical protein